MEKISISRALGELKTLDKRIDKIVMEFKLVTNKIGGKIPVKDGKNIEEFNQSVKSDFQKINDLIQRRRKIKAGIVNANSKTMVRINNENMTIAEAIERKNSISHEKELLRQIIQNFEDETQKIESHNEDVHNRLDDLLVSTFSKESSKVKSDEYDAVAKPFLQNNEALLVDPLNIKEQIRKLNDYIIGFEQEVDIILSETNAKTEIEI